MEEAVSSQGREEHVHNRLDAVVGPENQTHTSTALGSYVALSTSCNVTFLQATPFHSIS